MNRIGFDIAPGADGQAVGDLQAGLQVLLDHGLIDLGVAQQKLAVLFATERAKSAFGDATSRFVVTFQKQNGLDTTGAVDQKTADALNKALEGLGVLGPAGAEVPQQAARVVAGHVRDELGAGAGRILVRAFHADDRGGVRLGSNTTDADGAYSITYSPLPDGSAIRLQVVATDDAGERLAESDVLPDAGPLAVVDLVARRAAATPEPRRLEGRLTLAHGAAADTVELRLYQVAFGGVASELARTSTTNDGQFGFAYDAGSSALNLELRAVSPAGDEIALTYALTHMGVEPTARIRVVAPSEVQPPVAEYRRLADALTPHVGDLKSLADARETIDRRDLSTLNGATGWDARLIALAATAQRLEAETSLPAEALYGLLRAGLPSDPQMLAQLDAGTVGEALGQLAANGLVTLQAADIAGVTDAFKAFATTTRLAVPAPGSATTYGELLEGAGLGADKDAFGEVFLGHRDTGAALWQRARDTGVPETAISRLQLQGKLAFLAGNSGPVTQHLLDQLATPAPAGGGVAALRPPSELVALDLHDPEQWKSQLRALGPTDAELGALIPAAYEGSDSEARLDAYAKDMARKVRISYPTEVIGRLVETDAIPLGAAKQPALAVLAAAKAEGFTFGRTPIRAFMEERGIAVAGMTKDEVDGGVEQLKTLQRVYQITPGNDAMPVLLEMGLTSAYDVTALREADFYRRFDEAYLTVHKRLPTEAERRLVWRKAHQVSSMTYNLFAVGRSLDSGPILPTVSGTPLEIANAKQSISDTLSKRYPTMESLFGGMDFCECEHCQSVLSPAAYLVDLLQFLEGEPQAWANFLDDWLARNGSPYAALFPTPFAAPYDELMRRRPDLASIPLTCENTNVALPYIDIVNEILEFSVAHGALTGDAAYDTGDATTEDLLAEPQHVETTAYDTLRQERYPLTAPFDLWLATVRQFCAYAGTPLADVLETLRTTDDLHAVGAGYDRAATFLESLGISPDERALFADPAPLATWWQLFGYEAEGDALTAHTDEEGQRTDLRSAKALARRLGVTYKELVALLQTGFVNPDLAALRLLYKLPATVAELHAHLDPVNAAFLAANGDLLDPDLSAAQEARLKALAKADWERLTDLGAFAKRVAAYAEALGVPAADVEAELEAAPTARILVLADPDAGCDFDATTLRYADGTDADPAALLRLNLFVRLWRRLGWTMAEIDRALADLLPSAAPFAPAGFAKKPLETALIGFAHLKALDDRLRVAKPSRLTLLALWSDIATDGKGSQYARLFLTPTILRNDPIFDHPTGDYLSPAWLASKGQGMPAEYVQVRGHLPTVRSALGLTADEVAEILVDAELPPDAALSVPNLSTLYRYGLLAKALKLPVHDLITLKALSGLDPFARLDAAPLADLAHDHPYSGTIAFVDLADDVRGSGFKIADLDFLIRRRFDPLDPNHPGPDATFALLKTLGDGVRAIRADHAVPSDANLLTEDLLSQQVGLLLTPESTQRLLRLIRGEEKVDGPENPAGGPREFFDDHLRKGAVREPDDTGFLADADYPVLFEAVPTEAELVKRRVQIASEFVPVLQRRLVRQLAVTTLAADAGADSGLVDALVTDQSLLSLPGPGATRRPLMDAFMGTGAQGVDVAFFASVDGTGAAQATPPQIASVDTALRPPKDAGGAILPVANSARFEGFLAVPSTGAYRFSVELEKKGAAARLRFPHLPQPELVSGVAAADGTVLGTEANAFVELQAGVLYRFSLAADALAGGRAQVLVQGEVSALGPMDQLLLVPATALDEARRAYELLGGALMLSGSLELGQREVRYILGHPGAWAGIDLAAFPTEPAADPAADAATATSRFRQVLRLADYCRLRGEMAGGTDDLIGIFEADATSDAGRLDAVVYPLIGTITRRAPAIVKATAEALAAAPSFPSDVPLERLWSALQLVERLGASAATIRGWTRIVVDGTPDAIRFTIARDVKESIRARFDQETWRAVAQPIFDTLRRQQRDALVNHIVRREHFKRIEQVYEHFLLDPAMEPVVQTSRIRLASASVQLFVQRCLLNLEAQVHPSAIINADQWDWMKRYRVWEANRKIFLFPENWLEPEFRDDKTHLFAELEGALLKDDVSADSVEDAFLVYLGKLEELARLDIVAMHLETRPDFGKNTLHVFGRTFNQPYAYFYRRYANDMWTPWEPVTAEVEGDHLVPVVWRDRLYLFWVTFLESAAPVGQQTTMNLSSNINLPSLTKSVEAQLHWSEYHGGTWSTGTTGGYTQPSDVRLRVDGLSPAFTPQDVFVYVSVIPDPSEGEETPAAVDQAGVYVHLGDPISQAFHLASRHAVPEASRPTTAPPTMPYMVDHGRHRATRYVGGDNLTVTYSQRVSTEPGKTRTEPVRILDRTGAFTILACDNTIHLAALPEAETTAQGMAEIESLMKPIFFQDAANTLFLEPDVTERTIEEWQDWVTRTPVPEPDGPIWFKDPGWWQKSVKPAWPKKPGPDPWGPIELVADPSSIIHVAEGTDWLVNEATGLLFDGAVVGPTGSVPMNIVATQVAGVASAGGSPVTSTGAVVRLTAGSEVAAGSVGLMGPAGVGAAVGLRPIAAGIGVVGGAGLSAALQANVKNVDAAQAGFLGMADLGAMAGPGR
jgi:hypothetical protein